MGNTADNLMFFHSIRGEIYDFIGSQTGLAATKTGWWIGYHRFLEPFNYYFSLLMRQTVSITLSGRKS